MSRAGTCVPTAFSRAHPASRDVARRPRIPHMRASGVLPLLPRGGIPTHVAETQPPLRGAVVAMLLTCACTSGRGRLGGRSTAASGPALSCDRTPPEGGMAQAIKECLSAQTGYARAGERHAGIVASTASIASTCGFPAISPVMSRHSRTHGSAEGSYWTKYWNTRRSADATIM